MSQFNPFNFLAVTFCNTRSSKSDQTEASDIQCMHQHQGYLTGKLDNCLVNDQFILRFVFLAAQAAIEAIMSLTHWLVFLVWLWHVGIVSTVSTGQIKHSEHWSTGDASLYDMIWSCDKTNRGQSHASTNEDNCRLPVLYNIPPFPIFYWIDDKQPQFNAC